MTDAEFIAAVEACALPGEQWTHAAHVRLGWLYVSTDEPFELVMARARRVIRRFNEQVLHKEAYHETITYAFLRLIEASVRGGPRRESFEEFCLRCPTLLSFQALSRHYSEQLLYCDRARQEVVQPDVAPLP